MPRRHITEFESRDAGRSYAFPLLGGDYEEIRELITPNMRAVGMNGSVDLLGFAKSIEGPRIVVVRNLIDGEDIDEIDDNIETCLSTLHMIGRGKLFTSRGHWTWARLTELPEITYQEGQHLYMPSSAAFRADEDWYSATQEESSFGLGGTSPNTITVFNPGTIQALVMEIELRGTASGNTTSVTLTNLNNGYSIGTNRDLNGTAQRVLIKTGVPSMEYSANSGGTWTADYANRIIGVNQAQWMVLEPGNNSIQVVRTGVANVTVIFRFYAPFKT